MAEEKTEPRETSWRQMMPWTELFRTFQVALDLNKLFLAAAGIFMTALGWCVLAWIFGSFYDADPPTTDKFLNAPENERWKSFKDLRDSWNVMHHSAGVGQKDRYYWEPEDLAGDGVELTAIKAGVEAWKAKGNTLPAADPAAFEVVLRTAFEGPSKKETARVSDAKLQVLSHTLGKEKQGGVLATWPWAEERGPNPFLLVTGQSGQPWMTGQFWDWLTTTQVPVLIEPLVKFLRPIIFFLSPGGDVGCRLYFLCVLIWTLLVWSLFGGAITRIAAVQVARGEKIGFMESVRYTLKRYLSYITAPLFPLAFVLVLLILMVLFGFFYMIPFVGDILVAGIFWPLMIIVGLFMAIALIGLVGWPLMAATISTEGTDTWEAVSRSYSYVFQKPWHFLWYTLVSMFYGAVVVFFIGFLGSFTVYLSKWGVSKTPWVERLDRDPARMFVYSPTSFGWRTLLLDGAHTNSKDLGGRNVVQNGTIDQTAYANYLGEFAFYNKIGAGMVAFWVGLVFLLVLGFGYSFFWSAATIVYLLMRKCVDGADLDEVYLEDEDETPFGPTAPSGTAPAVPPKPGLTMVEAPTMRPIAPASAPPPGPPPAPAPVAPPPSAPTGTDTHPPFENSPPPGVSAPPEASPPPASPEEKQEGH